MQRTAAIVLTAGLAFMGIGAALAKDAPTFGARDAHSNGRTLPITTFSYAAPDRFFFCLEDDAGVAYEVVVDGTWWWDGVEYTRVIIDGEAHVLVRYTLQGVGGYFAAADDDPTAIYVPETAGHTRFLKGIEDLLREVEEPGSYQTLAWVPWEPRGCLFCDDENGTSNWEESRRTIRVIGDVIALWIEAVRPSRVRVEIVWDRSKGDKPDGAGDNAPEDSEDSGQGDDTPEEEEAGPGGDGGDSGTGEGGTGSGGGSGKSDDTAG
jgi:hypothetical protein